MKIDVAPLVGARIEIGLLNGVPYDYHVAPLVGARIEIPEMSVEFVMMLSLPSWERGLKFL